MALKYPTLDSWLVALLHLLNGKWDAWILNCGEEGTGKSKWSRKVSRRLNYLMRHPEALVQMTKGGPKVRVDSLWRPNFPLPRPFALDPSPLENQPGDSIRFGQDSLLDLLVELEVGGIAIGDEIEGHKRLAMYGQRLELLDHTKEARALRHTVWLNFPQFTYFESNLTNTRIRYWAEHERRGRVVVRERKSKTVFDKHGKPTVDVKWPIVARFSTEAGNDPWEPHYERKKDSRMRNRNARRQDGDDAPAAQAPRSTRIPPAILDMVLAEAKK